MTTDTKTALLDCATKAAMSRGFDGFSYADLSAAVGIRKASIHHHFPTKAALSAALVERYHQQNDTACARIAETAETGAERLAAMIDIYRQALNGGETLCLCVSFSISTESLTDEVSAQITGFRAMMRRWFKEAFAQGAKDGSLTLQSTPHKEALYALALLEGAHLAARCERNTATFEHTVEVLRARF